MSLLRVMQRAAGVKVQRFVAPLTDARSVKVATLQQGTLFKYDVVDPRSGWWWLQPVQAGATCVVQEGAPASEIVPFLQALPRYNCIALKPVSPDNSVWLVIPRSDADVRQRGWRNLTPRLMHLTRHDLDAFDPVIVRSIGGVLIYDDVQTKLDSGYLRYARRALINDMKLPGSYDEAALSVHRALSFDRWQAREEELSRAVLEKRKTFEGRMQEQLEFMGAELKNWYEKGNAVRVTWSHQGFTYEMDVQRSMVMESAGICLANTDREHTLSSIVAVMMEARKLNRPGAGGLNQAGPDYRDDDEYDRWEDDYDE